MPDFETEFDKHYAECVAVLRRTGSSDATYDSAKAIADDDYRNRTLARLAVLFGATGNVTEALRFSAAISRPLDRADALTDLGLTLVKNHRFDQAEEVLRKAEEASDLIERHDEAAAVLLETGELFEQLDNKDESRRLLQRAVALAQPLPQNFEAAKTLRGCARVLTRWNRIPEAITVAQAIDRRWSDLRDATLREIQNQG